MDSSAHVGASLLAAGYQATGVMDDPNKLQPRDTGGDVSSEEEEDCGTSHPHNLNLAAFSESEEDDEGDGCPAAQGETEVNTLQWGTLGNLGVGNASMVLDL